MATINIGIVGTNWISESFVKASRQVEGANVIAIFSRKLETAQEFASKTQIANCYTDYSEMLNNNNISAVYIASPNSLHYQYSKEAILMGKHVLCEKPFTSNKRELQKLIELAKEKKVLLMEAIKTLAMPSYLVLKNSLSRIGQIRQVNFQKHQYSSRYPEYLANQLPNVFNPQFSGGALLDIGVYCVYPAIDLFSIPKSIQSIGTLLNSGVDGSASSIWEYDGFHALISFSKIVNSTLPSEILGEKGCLLIDSISNPSRIEYVSLKGDKEILFEQLDKDSMAYEIQEFVNCIHRGLIDSPTYSQQLALNVMQTLDSMRQQLGVNYPSDTDNESV